MVVLNTFDCAVFLARWIVPKDVQTDCWDVCFERTWKAAASAGNFWASRKASLLLSKGGSTQKCSVTAFTHHSFGGVELASCRASIKPYLVAWVVQWWSLKSCDMFACGDTFPACRMDLFHIDFPLPSSSTTSLSLLSLSLLLFCWFISQLRGADWEDLSWFHSFFFCVLVPFHCRSRWYTVLAQLTWENGSSQYFWLCSILGKVNRS